jgi:hypothetical protein
MSEKQLRTVLQEIADARIPPETVNLWPRVRKGLGDISIGRRRRVTGLSVKIALPVLIALALLAISLIVVGPERALAALRGLLGYIPGIGLVDEDGGLRVLAEPVSVEQGGITVTVEQAVLDANQTVVIYSADGIPPEAYAREEPEQPRAGVVLTGPAQCSSTPALRLPDGELLQSQLGGGGGWSSGYRSRMVYPAIPPDVNEAALLIPCLQDTSPGAAPENWEVGLRFIPAPPDLTAMPVLEITETPDASVPQAERQGAGLYLEKVIELEDGFILTGTFLQGADFPGARLVGSWLWQEILDINGHTIPFTIPSDLDLIADEPGMFPWAYEIKKGFADPLTIVFEAVEVEFPVDASFQFDAGQDPNPGQEWELDQTFELAGHVVELVSATRHEYSYEFKFQSDTAAFAISIEDSEHTAVGGFGGGQWGNFSAGIEYADPVPTGLLQYHISRIMVRQSGPWTLTWEPPDGYEPAPTRSAPQVCLTAEGWQQAIEGATQRPEGVMGKVIVYGRIHEDSAALSPSNAGVFVVNLGDGSRQVLGPGTWPSLSPDGTRAAYSGTDGIHVVDLDSGQNRVLPGTSDYDYNPRWSPDGSQLAFVRINDLNLYTVNIDGTGMQQVTEGPEYELLIDWLPDGQTLVYVFPGPTGLQLRFLNLATREQQDGFVVNSKGANLSISPDGQRIAFLERVEGGMNYGLYVAALDGSNRRLIAQLGHWGLSDPRWSPDGTWLSLGITNTDQYDSGTATVAINPTTCEVFPLEGIEGYVQDWSH